MHFGRFVRTVTQLKPVQVGYRLKYLLLDRLEGSRFNQLTAPSAGCRQLHFDPIPRACKSYEKGSFSFLNQSYDFKNRIDWNYSGFGRLWTYNLNYFDYLHQDGITTEEGLHLIRSFIDSLSLASDGIEPYPTSVRGINWILFLSHHGVNDSLIAGSLFSQYLRLSRRPEYHLLGNHLLENGLSLLFAGIFFNHQGFKATARKILEAELKEQILPDGAHFERSPMYHQVLLMRILHACNLLKNNSHDLQGLEHELRKQAARMMLWLKSITYADGTVPMVNDSAPGIAPSTLELEEYAIRLSIPFPGASVDPVHLSGYRLLRNSSLDLFVDAGEVGPKYIPGHAHADTLGFELRAHGRPFITDTGTSTYENNNIRHFERSTRAHNTVEVNGTDSSEVWASHRTGRMARVDLLGSDAASLEARHDGYRHIGVIHRRRFEVFENQVTICDMLEGNPGKKARAFFHFSPGLEPFAEGDMIRCGGHSIHFAGHHSIEISTYPFARGFNDRTEAPVIVAEFTNRLTTTITISR